MAAPNFTPIQLYRSSTALAVPDAANLASGELALNIADGKLYFKNISNAVTLLASTGGSSGDVVGPASATDGNLAAFDGTTGKLIKQAAAVTIAQGGTGQTTQQTALNALVGSQTANRVLRSDGTNSALGQVALATDVSGTLPIANGGTGETTAAAAITGLGATTVGGNMFTLTNPSAITFPRFNADNTVSALSAADFRTAIGSTTVGANLFTLTNPAAITFPRFNADNTVSALSDANFRTAIGSTTVGGNMFTLTNPTAVTFPRFNADNTVSALNAADFRTAIGAGTGGGTVTSVTGTSPVASSGGATPAISLDAGYGDTLNPYASKTAKFFLAAPTAADGIPGFRALVAADLSDTLTVAKGGTGLTTYTANGVLYASGAGTLANGTGLTFDGTKLGLGVPAPFYTLDVAMASGTFMGSFKNSSTASNQANIVLWSQGESGSAVGYVGTGGSTFSGAFSNKFVVGTQGAHDLGLVTNGSLRALIDSTGTFRVVGAGTAGSTDAVQFNVAAPANAMVLNSSGNLSVPGTITSTLSGTASTATNIAAGAANQIPRQSGAGATTFIVAPTTASTFLTWDGSAFAWTNVAPSGSTFATDISVNTLTVGKGPNNPVGTTTFGYQAGAAATALNTNQTAIGYRALATSTSSAGASTDPDGSTAVGYRALELSNPTSLGQNTAVGAAALRNIATGALNTAVGAGAAQFAATTSSSITAIGALAGNSSTVGSFVAVGTEALRNSTDKTNGSVAVGNQALYNATTYSGNATIFNQNNTAVGFNALYGLSAETSTLAGSTNTALGRSAGSALESGSNNTLIGSSAQASTTSISNEITLGNSSITTLRCQVTSITSLSDQRDKHSIEDLPVGLALINALRPRRYKWDKRDWYIDEVEREDGVTDFVPVPQDGSRAQNDWNEGFVAQEAKAALEAAGASWFPLVYETNPEKLEMSSGKLIPVLVKAIQELTARLEALEAK